MVARKALFNLTARRDAITTARIIRLLAICAAFAMSLAPAKCGAANASAGPTKIAVYIGDGAKTVGAFRWLELTACMKDAEVVPVDAASVKGGVLDGMDVLVVPGGRSVLTAKVLGEEGRTKVKSFVQRGGGYIGTCAGCCLTMEPTKGHPNMMNMIPFTFGEQGGKDSADLLIHFNHRAEALAGIKKGNRRIKFSDGPVLIPSLPVKDAEVEVVASYASDVNTMGDKSRRSMAGQAAAVAGMYGKGRLFVMSVHPECDVADHDILRGAFRYLTGRNIEWEVPQRRRGQLSVGIVCDDSLGVETARLLQRTIRSGAFDMMPLKASWVADGALRHLDAVLIPDCLPDGKPKMGILGGNLERTREFLARGGRVFVWGCAAEAAHRIEPRITLVADGDAAVGALKAFAGEPNAVPPTLPPKVAKPLRAAIYADKGGSNVPVAELLALAPEYELRVLDAEDYRRGGLDGVDLLVQPGGLSKVQYDNLGPEGVAALKRYVTEGGRYYGICAGAFLASQPVPPTERGMSRLGLVPFKADSPDHYRGWAPMKVAFTDEGRASLGLTSKNRTMMYWGGPAFLDGDPVPDSDVKVWGRYVGRIVNTYSSRPIEDMSGKAALVGGRVGKGRVFVTCPHPEKNESNLDVVKGGIKYLTGVEPSAVNHDRVRGAVSVFFRSAKEKSAAELYLGTLLRDRRLDVRGGSHLYADMLPHLDVVVLPSALEEEDEAIAFLGGFVARGGRVVVVADTEKKRKLSEKIPGAIAVASYDGVMGAIL